jgi:hypothetical protein
MYGQYTAVHAPPNPGMPLAHIPALPLAGQCAQKIRRARGAPFAVFQPE